ncbi:hypothetical protein E2562_004732 [Oryza meyeriana var. granulata]|uniref:Neprosin PEP catalytic domain-containing protein n=1 Tax=Oryza meyeriana var. granulata TaxID=110450 RepID=A0A6G1DE81_9ORYZ|nr:hypothetical protein E2562_004732 [Oryza meyeriana var. granulata]
MSEVVQYLEGFVEVGIPPSATTTSSYCRQRILKNDGGVEHNCFNLDCGGFHLQSSSFALGSSWSNSLSQSGGERYGVTLSIHRF